jgi:hypothetical protein
MFKNILVSFIVHPKVDLDELAVADDEGSGWWEIFEIADGRFHLNFPWLVIQLLSILSHLEFVRFFGGWLRYCPAIRQLGTIVVENGADGLRLVGVVWVPFTIEKLIPMCWWAPPRSDGSLGGRLSCGKSVRRRGVFVDLYLLVP